MSMKAGRGITPKFFMSDCEECGSLNISEEQSAHNPELYHVCCRDCGAVWDDIQD